MLHLVLILSLAQPVEHAENAKSGVTVLDLSVLGTWVRVRCDQLTDNIFSSCARLGKPCVYKIDPRRRPTEILQGRIEELEGRIAALSASPGPSPPFAREILAHSFFNRDPNAEPPTQQLLPMFPHAIWTDDATHRLHFDAHQGYSWVIHRDVVETALERWDQSYPVPLDLLGYL